MLNIYSKYIVKASWPTWRKFSRINKHLQRGLKSGQKVDEELFALQIVLNDQLLKWYNLTLSQRANQKVENQIVGREAIAKQMDLTDEDLEALSDNYFFNTHWKLILIRALGIDYLLYNDGFGLRDSSSTLQGIRGFLFYFNIYYLIPLLLYWNFQLRIFDLLALFFFLINAARSYSWLKTQHFKTAIDELFDREKITLIHD